MMIMMILILMKMRQPVSYPKGDKRSGDDNEDNHGNDNDDGDYGDDYGDSDDVADYTDEEEAACELLKGG